MGEKNTMINRREFDQNLKDILIEYDKKNKEENKTDLIKASWEELADILDLDLPKTKYHIFKLEQQGFLRVIERAQRANGYTSPNTIKILPNTEVSGDAEDVLSDVSKSLGDLQKWAQTLQQKERNIEAYEDEIKRLTITNKTLEAKIKSLTGQLLQMQNQIYEMTQLKH